MRQISLSNPRLALHWPVREANLGGPTRARSRGGGGGTRGLARFDRAPCSRKRGYSAGVPRRYPRRVSGRASGPAATSPRTRPTPIFTSVTTSTVTKGRKRGGGVSGGGRWESQTRPLVAAAAVLGRQGSRGQGGVRFGARGDFKKPWRPPPRHDLGDNERSCLSLGRRKKHWTLRIQLPGAGNTGGVCDG